MYNETITIFNRYGNRADGDKWYPHVLKNVCVYRDRATIVASMGENSTDNVSIIIRIEKGCKASGYKYKLPIEWKNDGKYAKEFTVRGGNDFDFIYCGAWSGGQINDDDYSSGFFNYMRLNYDGVYIVTSCSDYSKSILPHLEVMAQ